MNIYWFIFIEYVHKMDFGVNPLINNFFLYLNGSFQRTYHLYQKMWYKFENFYKLKEI